MSQDTLGAIEIQEGKAAPEFAGRRKNKFSLLAGAVVLIALAAIGVGMRASRTRPIKQDSDQAAEMTVTVVHPQKASITIPVLPRTNGSLYGRADLCSDEWLLERVAF
jgi:cell division septation protein DedD